MKHLLNNLSSEEKSRILEQHSGGKSIDTSKFKKLIESKSGDVKPLINEQSTSVDESLNEWGKNVFQKIKGTQVVSYEIDFDNKPIGEAKSYWIDSLTDVMTTDSVGSLYELTYVALNMKGHTLSDDLKGTTKVDIDFRITMSKGRAVGISRVYLFTNNDNTKVKNLQVEPFEKKLIPKMNVVQVINPCFDGFRYFKNGGYTNMEELKTEYETFEKSDGKNNEIRLYKDKGNWVSGTGQIIPYNVEFGGKIQTITWACSNGKLTINK
jgi:hypothetical protein